MNKPELHEINVGMGATSLIGPLTGMGIYTLNLANELAKSKHFDIKCFYGYKWSDNIEPVTIPNVNVLKGLIRRYIPQSYNLRRKVQQHAFNQGLKNIKLDVYHETSFVPYDFAGPKVITVHDLSHVRFPQAHPKERIDMLQDLLPPAIENSQSIIANSFFTKKEILSEFAISADKVHVTQLGKSEDFYPREKSCVSEVVNQHGLRVGQYVIAVGTLEPRKNLTQAIETYNLLPDKLARRFPLVIIGMRGWKENALVSALECLVKQGRAKMLGYVSNHDLPYLYCGARSLVFPSLYEGFGLPVLEAMASGTPVIASNSSSIPEVVGEAGILVDVGDVDAMKINLETICEDDIEFNRLSKLGLVQAEKFSWEKCGKDTRIAYQYALEQG